ncbi:MAG: efflux RND transporter permease subunit [Candidatus Scalindua sp.]|jgi:HAE1 family hydrophobic/amphiphilic exporter-1|nr:efflux RND transporter permease subunit [Candidatus Scalindua sp.]MDV5166728.1 efflux RND transporter permease subunit [Candidatus Scalindua sp.]
MKIIEYSTKNPVKVAVGSIFVLLFGFLALFRIPVQLVPDVERPQITVETRWIGASPEEVEQEIIHEQEEMLKSVENLRKMTSKSFNGRGQILLEFVVGVDKAAALLDVANKLNQVREYPENVDEPVIKTVNTGDRPIAWFTLRTLPGNDVDINELRDFAEDHIESRFERVPGVANSNIYGGAEREMQVVIDPHALASTQLTILDVRRALTSTNSNISGGDIDEGKNRFVVRTLGQFKSVEEIENLVITKRDDIPVYVRDIAEVRLGYKKLEAFVRQKNEKSVAINAQREVGANVLTVMEGLREACSELNENLLIDRGLTLEQVYDETEYIESSIGLVRQNVVVGGLLAIMVLILFLRNWRSTLVIGLAIPISAIGTFLMVTLLGRTLNVVSLAGIAFAVGMVVDSAIVVLENIFRHWQSGEDPFEAAYKGTAEVWGAVLASTLTTIGVFVPVILVEQEVGQLFRDIALAISFAVGLSLIVAITVIPTTAARILSRGKKSGTDDSVGGTKSVGSSNRLVLFGRNLTDKIVGVVDYLTNTLRRRLVTIFALVFISIFLTWWMIPEMEYLPEGNRNLILAIMLPPPGYSLEEQRAIGLTLEKELSPYWIAKVGTKEAEMLDGPPIKHGFYVSRGRSVFMGMISAEPERVAELIPVLRRICGKIPGMITIVQQSSLFERGLSGGRTIDIELSGPDLNRLVYYGAQVFGQVIQVFPPGTQARPVPSLELGSPELQVRPRLEHATELGLTSADIGYIIDTLVDGAFAGDYWHEGDKIDLVIFGQRKYIERTQDLEQIFIFTPSGDYVPLSTVADIQLGVGPEEIDHIERERSIVIQVIPPRTMPLERALGVIDTKILAPMVEKGLLGGLYKANLAGTADKLQEARRALQWNLILAIGIAYLLMAALFESFLYPLVIMCSVPLAAVGGFVGLATLNIFTLQVMDVLTMLGFVILIGTVINNAILIVHQALNNMREEKMGSHPALIESVRTRIRPIFMSVTTTVFGMMPLVIFPGAGSELYRGLGSVVLGGLIVSTIFTLLLIPAVFSLVMEIKKRLGWSM